MLGKKTDERVIVFVFFFLFETLPLSAHRFRARMIYQVGNKMSKLKFASI